MRLRSSYCFTHTNPIHFNSLWGIELININQYVNTELLQKNDKNFEVHHKGYIVNIAVSLKETRNLKKLDYEINAWQVWILISPEKIICFLWRLLTYFILIFCIFSFSIIFSARKILLGEFWNGKYQNFPKMKYGKDWNWLTSSNFDKKSSITYNIQLTLSITFQNLNKFQVVLIHKSVKFEKPAGSSSFLSNHTDLFFIQICWEVVLLWKFSSRLYF